MKGRSLILLIFFCTAFAEISDAQLIFIQRPTDILNARIGCDYAVSCTVSGADQLEWRLTNGDAIMNSDTRSTSMENFNNSTMQATLTFTPLGTEHLGTYICFAFKAPSSIITVTFIIEASPVTESDCKSIHCTSLKAVEDIIIATEGVDGGCITSSDCLDLSCSLTRTTSSTPQPIPTTLSFRLLPGSQGPHAIGIDIAVVGMNLVNGVFSENTTVPVAIFGLNGTARIWISQLCDGVIATVILQFSNLPPDMVLQNTKIQMCRSQLQPIATSVDSKLPSTSAGIQTPSPSPTASPVCTKGILCRTMEKLATSSLKHSGECSYSLQDCQSIKCSNRFSIFLPELGNITQLDTNIKVITDTRPYGVHIEISYFPFSDPIVNGTFFESAVINSDFFSSFVPIRSTINITQLPDGLELSANVFAGFMRRFSADVNIVLFDRVKLDLCPYKPITATSSSLPLPSPTSSCQNDLCQSQNVMKAAISRANSENFVAVCSGSPFDDCAILGCLVNHLVGDSVISGSMSLHQKYCENSFEFTIAIRNVTSIFVNHKLSTATVTQFTLYGTTTTVFIKTEVQSNGIILNLKLELGSLSIAVFDNLFLPVKFPLCCDETTSTMPIFPTVSIDGSMFSEITSLASTDFTQPSPFPTSSPPPPPLTCMEMLCQSLDSIESALLSVRGFGLSVEDGHCNQTNCRELHCNINLVSVTLPIEVNAEYKIIPCGEKHAFYMKMEVLGGILMEGTFSETTSIATSIFDSPGNIDVIIVPALNGIRSTIELHFLAIPRITVFDNLFIPFCCPMEVAPVTDVTISEKFYKGRPALLVSWEEPASNPPVTGYYVEYKEQNITYWNTMPYPTTVFSSLITDLHFGTEYEVRVKSTVDNYGNSTYSNISSLKTSNPHCPTIPSPNVYYDRTSGNMTFDRRPPMGFINFMSPDSVTCKCIVRKTEKDNCLPIDTIHIDLSGKKKVGVQVVCRWTQNNILHRNAWIFKVPL